MMRRTIWAGAGLMALSGCSGGSEAVGENSVGSIKTTAVGNVVAAIPSPTPSPTAAADAIDATPMNATDMMAGDSTSNATTTDH